MTVAAGVLFQIVLMVFLRRIKVYQRANLYEKGLAAAALNGGDALDRFLGPFIGIIDASLILAAPVVALPVLHRGINDVEISQ